MSRLPTEEIFTFNNDDAFPLNLATLARKQLVLDDYLQLALQQQQPDYVIVQKEGNQIYVYKPTQTIYVPAFLHAAILQWYHTSLLYPGIKHM